VVNDIEVKDVDVWLGGRQVLQDLTFSVPHGEFLGVIGPNGAGKTTFMRLLLGLIQPQAGTVTVLGETRRKKIAPLLGYVPQARHFDPETPISVREFVSFGLPKSFRPWLSRKEKKAVDEVIQKVGAEVFADQPIGRLSGGERQRLFLAQALLGNPRCLLLDEPTSNLDPGAQERLTALVDQLRKERDMTVVFISHDINLMARYADRILYLTHGHYAYGRVEEVLTAEVLTRLYGTPMKVSYASGEIMISMADEDEKAPPICVHYPS
jgi:zinc/manganese transport system ATP-binding protein